MQIFTWFKELHDWNISSEWHRINPTQEALSEACVIFQGNWKHKK